MGNFTERKEHKAPRQKQPQLRTKVNILKNCCIYIANCVTKTADISTKLIKERKLVKNRQIMYKIENSKNLTVQEKSF